jgi:hypothetical protein
MEPAAGIVFQLLDKDEGALPSATVGRNTVLTGDPANVTATTWLPVSSTPGGIVGGGAPNMALVVGVKDGLDADTAHVSAMFWLQALAGDSEPTRLQYFQIVLLNFNGLSWPHITMATLTKAK